MPFEKWESGEELFITMDRDIDLLDRDVRVWVEECDQMQGFQIYTGGDDAWAGFAARYIERLRDEFGKTAIWAWGIEDQPEMEPRAHQLIRTLNTAKMIYETSTHASMYIPLSLPTASLPQNVHLNRKSNWHSSALIATAVESVTLPSRLRQDVLERRVFGDLETTLNTNGNQWVAQLQCSILEHEDRPPRSGHAQDQHCPRISSNSNFAASKEDEIDTGNTDLDIKLSGGSYGIASSFSHQDLAMEHVFGALDGIRGNGKVIDNPGFDDNDEITSDQRGRRFDGTSTIERFVRESTLFISKNLARPTFACV